MTFIQQNPGPSSRRPFFPLLLVALLAANSLWSQTGTMYSLTDKRNALSFSILTGITTRQNIVINEPPKVLYPGNPVGMEFRLMAHKYYNKHFGISYGGQVGFFPIDTYIKLPLSIDEYSTMMPFNDVFLVPYIGGTLQFIYYQRIGVSSYLSVGPGISFNKFPTTAGEVGVSSIDSTGYDRQQFTSSVSIDKRRAFQLNLEGTISYYHHIGRLCYIYGSLWGAYSPFPFVKGQYEAYKLNGDIATGTTEKRFVRFGFEVGFHWALINRKEAFGEKHKR